MKLTNAVATCGLMLGWSLFLAGCSSRPDEAQLKQLSDLKQEYASLQKEVAAKEDQTKALENGVAGKNAQLKKCHDDQQIVRSRLSSMKN